ncbi:hypothetical protein ACFLTB_03825 [Chloroflexota bacterium]
MKKRVYFQSYDTSGEFPDGRVKLDVFFKSSGGEQFVWTPDWEKGTRQFFLEAYRTERLNVPKGTERERFKQVAEEVLREEEQEIYRINFKKVAIELGEELKYQSSFNEIGRMASVIFDFNVSPHPHTNITSSRAQLVYDWVMTLSEQPISSDNKFQLLKQFIDSLTQEDSSLRGLL